MTNGHLVVSVSEGWCGYRRGEGAIAAGFISLCKGPVAQRSSTCPAAYHGRTPLACTACFGESALGGVPLVLYLSPTPGPCRSPCLRAQDVTDAGGGEILEEVGSAAWLWVS